jgi:hypothetical protein
MYNRIMKLLPSHDAVEEFISEHVNALGHDDMDLQHVLSALISGKIVLEKPSSNKIADQVVTGPNKATFYRKVHKLAAKMPALHENLVNTIQKDPALAMKKKGVISIDEHLLPHTSKKMEGVGYFYSTTLEDVMLALSMISSHYYDPSREYPVYFEFYRKMDELEPRGKQALYKTKNQVARDMIEKLCALPNCPPTFLIDSFFMSKDNVRKLKDLGRDYISRPKRNWSGTLDNKKQSLDAIFDSIPASEFIPTKVFNKKSRKEKIYYTATKDIFFKKIGTHRVVFIDPNWDDDGNRIPDVIDGGMVEESPAKRNYRVFIASNLAWDASTILSLYALRWTIETGYRDMSQNLGLHGCQWQELDGQHCFVALTFTCYLFLLWAKKKGLLDRHGVHMESIGDVKRAFIHYCQDEFASWLRDIREQCESCSVSKWIERHVFIGNG